MLSDALPLSIELPKVPDFNRLGERLPVEWIEAALASCGKASLRKRRLPAEQVVWLVIAMALYRRLPVKEIVDSLDLAMSDVNEPCITSSATTQARQRLGAQPLRWLFEATARRWIEQDDQRFLFNGLHVLAMDGTTLRLAESEANRTYFGAQNYPNDKVASYPQARGVTLIMLATQLIRDVRFGPYKTSEMSFAHELLESIPSNSLTVIDRGFFSAGLLCNLVSQGSNRHYLIPSKAATRWTLIEGTEVDGMVEMKVSSQARKIDPALPRTWQARALRIGNGQGKFSYLLTSLTDRGKFKAEAIIAYYAMRWRIETSYRELKHSMMGSALTLRSTSIDGTKQEIWGALIAYNLIRLEMAKAAIEADCEPTKISFTTAFFTIQNELMFFGRATSPGAIPARLRQLRDRLVLDLKAERPGRKFPRVVKTVAQRYPHRTLSKKTLT